MEISNFLKGSRYDSLIILTARKSSCKHVGYTLSDIHNETESIRTHPENNCSWFREARKSRDILGKRFSVTSTLDGLCLKTAPPTPPYKVRRERIQWRAVQETYNLKENARQIEMSLEVVIPQSRVCQRYCRVNRSRVKNRCQSPNGLNLFTWLYRPASSPLLPSSFRLPFFIISLFFFSLPCILAQSVSFDLLRYTVFISSLSHCCSKDNLSRRKKEKFE